VSKLREKKKRVQRGYIQQRGKEQEGGRWREAALEA